MPAFPLAVEPGKRYLVDAAGKPFLIHGDTAWSLIAQLTREEVILYLDDRRARGFNTILVNLIEHAFATNAPANAYGELPFHGQMFEAAAMLAASLPFERFTLDLTTRLADYSAPNEANFAHADWILRRAADAGFLVLLTPSYLGVKGGWHGWYQAMLANGPDRLRRYGEYLGRRYSDFNNILWVHAGDYNPPRKDLVRAIAQGIREFDRDALHTAHAAPGRSAIQHWGDEPWFQVNTIYTNKLYMTSQPVFAAALEQYGRPERMPFFLIETAYENNKGHEATEQRLRLQAYQAVLSGAAGHVFGNNPVWHFDGPGLYPAPASWQKSLGSRGAQSMTHLRNLMMAVPWWRLEPDTNHAILTDGIGPEEARAVAASTVDRSLAIIYIPSDRHFTVDLGQFAGPQVSALWYDPADGQFSADGGSPFAARGTRRFGPQLGNNSSRVDDWVLILEAQS
jgi:hypothetical protein